MNPLKNWSRVLAPALTLLAASLSATTCLAQAQETTGKQHVWLHENVFPESSSIDDLFNLILYMTGAVGVGVFVVLAIFLGGALLLFDEADALFGARGDGQETGERYANMLTNFLLQRIEDHPGIAVLTSNSRLRIDAAFTRRLDAVLEFAQPGPAERRELWRSHLGERDPGSGVIVHLATWCDLPGGVIRNAVVAAAAACPGVGPIPPAALFAALAREYRKLGRALPAALAVSSAEES